MPSDGNFSLLQSIASGAEVANFKNDIASQNTLPKIDDPGVILL